MSVGSASYRSSRHGSKAASTRNHIAVRQAPSPTASASANIEPDFAPCAATASFLLYSQRSTILVLHQDTLAIERRFELHREDVLWIAVDNASDRGAGRLAVSYDTGHTAIVWDILTGGEVARFSAYERMRVATFMRNGNIAFGNDQGNIILFEPSTSEHISARTIFDPITALAPSSDCRTFAIGYSNGSVLVATLQPSFTILHTLTTSRNPARITGLAWHGSSSKQKTDMLATQNSDQDLRVWSIPKAPSHEPPNIIRVLHRSGSESQQPGPCWFAWSKNGRILQYAEGETRAWDVRTKKVSWEIIATGEGITGLTNYGPTAALFVLSKGHVVQQFDVSPGLVTPKVASAQHVPANTPPTPPVIFDQIESSEGEGHYVDTDDSGADEPARVSPRRRIAREMKTLDALESELRDKVTPLSPTSSRASSTSSRSFQSHRRDRKYLYDKPGSSRASTQSHYQGTEFSATTPIAQTPHDAMSIRSVSSYTSMNRLRQSNLRKEARRSPENNSNPGVIDLFPVTKARLQGIPFRTPHYGDFPRTPELLQREMLSIVFGWSDTVEHLIREELERHKPGSASAVLLAKWLGAGLGDSMSGMAGSDSMTSSDWMLLALSSIGPDSQKQVGEAFVLRLLERGEVHPAAAILIGLGEHNEAIEVYVSREFWVEAILLTCISYPSDWQRICRMLRKWGEKAVQLGQAELAVRLFSCTSIQTSSPYFPSHSQGADPASQLASTTSPGVTSPALARTASGRLTAKNASLKLITSFGSNGAAIGDTLDDRTALHNNAGVTPIAQSAMPRSAIPGGGGSIQPWLQSTSRHYRDPSSAMTMTPGGPGRSKRLPSMGEIASAKQEAAQLATSTRGARETDLPGTANSIHSGYGSSVSDNHDPDTAIRDPGFLPAPDQAMFDRLRELSDHRLANKERKSGGLAVQVLDTRYTDEVPSMPPPSYPTHSHSRTSVHSVSSTGRSLDHRRAGSLDHSVSTTADSQSEARDRRGKSKTRSQSKRRGESSVRSSSRLSERSDARSRHQDVRYINPAKRSPSSPVPMSPEEIAEAAKASRANPECTEDQKIGKSNSSSNTTAEGTKTPRNDAADVAASNRATSPHRKPRDQSRSRRAESKPSSPDIMQTPAIPDTSGKIGHNVRLRAMSYSSETTKGSYGGNRERERSRNRVPNDEAKLKPEINTAPGEMTTGEKLDSVTFSGAFPQPRGLSRKELAAKELEDRRLSLARRPSAPQIPLPGDIAGLPTLSSRAYNEPSFTMERPPFPRSQSASLEQASRRNNSSGSISAFGLPATPRAMKHPRQMNGDANGLNNPPPVPSIPDNSSLLSSVISSYNGSYASQSNLSSAVFSNVTALTSDSLVSNNVGGPRPNDNVGPLLPSTVFGQKMQKPPPRSASAPPEDLKMELNHPSSQFPKSPVGPNSKKISLPDSVRPRNAPSSLKAFQNIAETSTKDDLYMDVLPDHDNPVMLPELQHLADVPPPPPPPPLGQLGRDGTSSSVGSGLIDILISDNAPSTEEIVSNDSNQPLTYPHPMERATTASPDTHRRGRGSVSEVPSFGSRIRGLGERMRSSSRSRAKSPQYEATRAAPYESIVPPAPPSYHRRNESFGRAKSPYEKAMLAQTGSSISGLSDSAPSQLPFLPQTVHQTTALSGLDTSGMETTIPPARGPSRTASRNTQHSFKEVRANMPPGPTQQGVYPDVL